jgi:hypothetical protein
MVGKPEIDRLSLLVTCSLLLLLAAGCGALLLAVTAIVPARQPLLWAAWAFAAGTCPEELKSLVGVEELVYEAGNHKYRVANLDFWICHSGAALSPMLGLPRNQN